MLRVEPTPRDRPMLYPQRLICNPVLAKVASKMGKTTFYKYLDLYGITEKTGVDYPGEAGSIVQSLENVGPVELATIG